MYVASSSSNRLGAEEAADRNIVIINYLRRRRQNHSVCLFFVWATAGAPLLISIDKKKIFIFSYFFFNIRRFFASVKYFTLD